MKSNYFRYSYINFFPEHVNLEQQIVFVSTRAQSTFFYRANKSICYKNSEIYLFEE